MFFFITIAFFALYFMIIGGIMDTSTSIHNNLTQGANPAVPLSQDRQDALLIMQGAFRSLPIIVFILTIIVAIVYGLATRYQTV